MFGKIVYISDTVAHIQIPEGTPVATNLMNLHVMFEDDKKRSSEKLRMSVKILLK